MPSLKRSIGDGYDHDMCECFFATLERERVDCEAFATRAKARPAIFDYMEEGIHIGRTRLWRISRR